MLKSGYSREDTHNFGRDFAALKVQINEIYGHNQEMLNWPTNVKKDDCLLVGKKILAVIDPLLKMIKKYQGHFFCALLQQVTFYQTQNLPEATLLSKLIQSFMTFVKFKANFSNQGNRIWELVNYLYCYSEGMKDQKYYQEFRQDFELVERLKNYYVSQHQDRITDSIIQLKDMNPTITDDKVPKNWQDILKLGKKIVSTVKNNQNIHELNKSIDSLLVLIPTNICQQVQFNNLKQLYQSQLLRRNPKKLPCCSVYFHKSQKLQPNSHRYNDYEDVLKMPMNEQARNTVRKVMISFLNTDGGIHYIGIKRENDHLNVEGIWMNDTNLIDFFKDVYKIAREIQPNNEVDLEEPPKIPQNINEKLIYSLQLTRFVSVQINPLVDKNHGNIDYVQEHGNKKTGVRISVVKIKVKAAPKYDTYMAKGNGKGLESYYRSNGVIKKIQPSQFPKIFTSRSMIYMYEDTKPGNPDCPNCRHKYEVDDN